MISVDWSILPALIIFVLTVVALNYLLVRPITRIQEEREMRTSGLMSQTRNNLSHHLQLFEQYQATVKNARMDGYRLVEKARADAMVYRNRALERARKSAEQLMQETRNRIKNEADAAKVKLEQQAQDIARRITAAVLQRSA